MTTQQPLSRTKPTLPSKTTTTLQKINRPILQPLQHARPLAPLIGLPTLTGARAARIAPNPHPHLPAPNDLLPPLALPRQPPRPPAPRCRPPLPLLRLRLARLLLVAPRLAGPGAVPGPREHGVAAARGRAGGREGLVPDEEASRDDAARGWGCAGDERERH